MSFTPIPDPFLNHPDNANLPTVNKPATLIGTTVTFLILAFIAISLRLWVRIKDSLWGWDDAFVFLAGAASIGGDIIVCLMPADGQGRHLWTLSSENLMSYFRHVYSTNIAYCLSSTFIKLSILFQYLRLFAETMPPSQGRSHRIARLTTVTLIVLVALWGAAFSLLAIFSCDPIAKNWNPFMKGRCVGWGSKEPAEFFAMFVGHSASNMTLDIIVLLAPVPFLRMLRLAGKSKIGLVTLFILGCTVTSLAIGRMVSLSINRAGTIPVMDMSFHTPIIYIFSVLEVNIAIIAASIPIFWPVIAEYATNKIWVVNEIEIHVEEGGRDSFSSSGGIDLTKTTSWKQDKKEDLDPNTVSVLSKTYDRSTSRQNEHRHKMSNTSSLGRTVGRELGTRSSQDSQRALYRAGSNESTGRHAGVVRSEHDEWLGTLGRKMSVGHSTTTVEKALPITPVHKWEL